MENAIEGLKRLDEAPQFKVLDRRNLQVILPTKDQKKRELIKNIIKIAHGFVEADAPLGNYDKEKEELKRKRAEDHEKKIRSAAKGKH